MKHKTCTKCGEDKPETKEFFYFYKTRNYYSAACKICVNEINKTYNRKYPWKHIFVLIKRRCENKNDMFYDRYGGRGIECRITEEELKFLWFRDKAYEMEKPSTDRIDNDDHYYLDNCRFIEQSENSAKDKRVKIQQYDIHGSFIREWDSLMHVERELNIWHGNISKVLTGKRKSSGGYVWKYKNV